MRLPLLLAVTLPLATVQACEPPRGVVAGGELAPATVAVAWKAAMPAALSVEQVLAREAYRRCQREQLQAASAYRKQTEFDNTPYRFDMKPGQKLSAAEFDAWMASRGIRIVRARTEASEAAPAAATSEAPVAAN
ncbi:MAG: hypothetical protein KatS3mg126_0972 [Lysobacteraceae bacterium]|nr:MAG: hypothetical protein KatS3mg126_0972 [Xanthomonadaceae bacterium]